MGSPRTKKAQLESTPELKSKTRSNPKKDPVLGHLKPSQQREPAPGTTQPGKEDSGEPEERYGMTAEKARALPDMLASSG